MLTIKLTAPNDVNGNPRRVYVVFNEDGTIAHAVDEGYAGSGALREDANRYGYALSTCILEFETTTSEYLGLVGNDDDGSED